MLREIFVTFNFSVSALVGDMAVKYGHAFKMNYTVQRGFHVILLIANHAITHDFPDELGVVSRIQHFYSKFFEIYLDLFQYYKQI